MTPKTDPVFIKGPFYENRNMRRAMRMKPIMVKTSVTIVDNEGNERDVLAEFPSGELRPRRKGAGYTRKTRKGRRGRE